MPKIESKNQKFRKVAKGLGLGVLSLFATIGIVATIACLARCGEQPKQEASAEDVSLPYVRQPRKEAPQFTEDANVFVGDDFRFFPQVRFYGESGIIHVLRSTEPAAQFDWGSALGKVERAGLYYLNVPRLPNYLTSVNTIYVVNQAFVDDFEAIEFSDSVGFSKTGAMRYDLVASSTASVETRYVNVTQEEVDAGFYVLTLTAKSTPPRMYAMDMMEASPSDKVALPEGWKPYQLIDAVPLVNGYGIIRPRTSGSFSPTGAGVINGMLFRANGKLYNRIRVIPWTPHVGSGNTEAHTFGYYNAAGQLVWKSIQTSLDDYVLYRIEFALIYSNLPNFFGSNDRYADEVAFCPETSIVVEQQARVVYLSGGPLTWNSPLFRELDVLDVYDENIRPTDTLVARSPLEWLRLSLADVNPSAPTTDVGIEGGMTLVSDGLVAFMPILGVEVFPSISLGLLLILPLIGGIIVLIVKVFSK